MCAAGVELSVVHWCQGL